MTTGQYCSSSLQICEFGVLYMVFCFFFHFLLHIPLSLGLSLCSAVSLLGGRWLIVSLCCNLPLKFCLQIDESHYPECSCTPSWVDMGPCFCWANIWEWLVVRLYGVLSWGASCPLLKTLKAQDRSLHRYSAVTYYCGAWCEVARAPCWLSFFKFPRLTGQSLPLGNVTMPLYF